MKLLSLLVVALAGVAGVQAQDPSSSSADASSSMMPSSSMMMASSSMMASSTGVAPSTGMASSMASSAPPMASSMGPSSSGAAATGSIICTKYQSFFTSQADLVTKVVLRAVMGWPATNNGPVQSNTGIANQGNIVKFFNGNQQYRSGAPYTEKGFAGPTYSEPPRNPNFLEASNATYTNQAQTWLVNHLVQFFYLPLGCTADAAYAYTTPTGGMYAIHKGMSINNEYFTTFNNQIIGSAKSFGVAQNDLDQLQTILNSFGRDYTPSDLSLTANSICTQGDCPCKNGGSGTTCGITQTGTPNTDGGDASIAAPALFVTIFAAIAAILA